ncbi:4-hydroxyphenylacetate degradation bifunctional isomerase/decarboxylase,HpaG2 subunit [Alicyclobacillus hesperidum URH17-3-68]|nr:4-hydroxyphenylacetate degradation bifunctional isomerase/decarboxylase,HpaG2 subunit [Alicyclobacillus hesperidum URH17-3-68]
MGKGEMVDGETTADWLDWIAPCAPEPVAGVAFNGCDRVG